jgi:hypothetical protein
MEVFVMEKRNYQLLNEFLGMKCSVGFRSLTDYTLDASYVYQSFTYYLDDGFIYLEDETNNREAFTYFELDKVKEIKNLGDNLYHDVVSFKTDEYIIEVCTLEEPFVFPKCHKCGKDILIPEAVTWRVLGHSCFENPYDNDMDIIDNLNFCSECIVGFIGSIEDYNCVGEYSFS